MSYFSYPMNSTSSSNSTLEQDIIVELLIIFFNPGGICLLGCFSLCCFCGCMLCIYTACGRCLFANRNQPQPQQIEMEDISVEPGDLVETSSKCIDSCGTFGDCCELCGKCCETTSNCLECFHACMKCMELFNQIS